MDDREGQADIIENYMGMTYSEALNREVDKKDWRGFIATTARSCAYVAGHLESVVPYLGVVLACIAVIGEIYGGLKGHGKKFKKIWTILQDLRNYLPRLDGNLKRETLERTAHVVFAGWITIRLMKETFDGQRQAWR